jgi:hypothetical protein
LTDDSKPPEPTLPPLPSGSSEADAPARRVERKAGRPKGAISSKRRLMESRTHGYEVARDMVEVGDKGLWYRKRTADALSQDDWVAVYNAYKATGDPTTIAEQTGLSTRAIRMLLDDGLVRLGLRPIREVAVDHIEVNKRVEQLLGAAGPKIHSNPNALPLDPKRAAEAEALVRNMPDVERAITDRAIRETTAAQTVLLTSIRSNDVLLGYVNKLLERVTDPEGGYLIPEKISGAHLESLAKAVNSLASATEKAIVQSRLAAGEPTQHIAVQVAGFVSQFSPEELRHYVLTKELPPHLRIRGGSRDSVQSEPASSLPVIEATVEPESKS